MFTRFAALRERCDQCGLDFRAFDINPRIAGLIVLILSGAIAYLAIRIDLAWRPPLLLHLAWLPLTVAAIIFCLRTLKALSVAGSDADERP